MKKRISKKIFHFSDLIIELKKEKRKKTLFLIRAPKVPFNFHFKIGMENDIFLYSKFDSKLKIEERKFSIFNFY